MKKTIGVLGLLALAVMVIGQGIKISQLPPAGTIEPTDMVVAARTNANPHTNVTYRVGDALALLNNASNAVYQQPFSIVHLCDLQIGVDSLIPTVCSNVAYWIMANRSTRNIKAVVFSGDISYAGATNVNFVNWSNAFAPVSAVMPFIQVSGNHDTDAGLGGWTIKDYGADTTNWNNVFGFAYYTNRSWWNGGFYTNMSSEMLYCRVPISQYRNMLIIGLSPNPNVQHYNWASNICATYSNDLAVLLQHQWVCNEQWTDKRSTAGDIHIAGTVIMPAEDAWNRSVRFWRNLNFIFSGHFIPVLGYGPKQTARDQSIGYFGNPVISAMHNYQTTNEVFPHLGYQFQCIKVDPWNLTMTSEQITNADPSGIIEPFPNNNYSASLAFAGAGFATMDRLTVMGSENGATNWQSPELRLQGVTNRSTFSLVNNQLDQKLDIRGGTNTYSISNNVLATLTADGKCGINTNSPQATFQTLGETILGYPDSDGAFPLRIFSNGRIDIGGRIVGGVNNTAIGRNALQSNTTGQNNSAIGFDCLSYNTSGGANTAVGYDSLWAMTTGSGNTALGSQPGLSNLVGSYNTFIGAEAGRNGTNGSYNTMIGGQSGYYFQSNAQNVAVGYDAGFNLTMGNSNILIGSLAGQNLTVGSRNIIIGDSLDAQAVNSSNLVMIGNSLFWDDTTGIGTFGGVGREAEIQFYGNTPMLTLRRIGGYSGQTRFNIANEIGTGQEMLAFEVANDAGAIQRTPLVIYGLGNVGIGTNIPSARLQVTGDNSQNLVVQCGTTNVPTLLALDTNGVNRVQGGTFYPTNTVPSTVTAAALGVGGYWVGNSNGSLVTIYSLDGSTTVMKVLAP